MTKKEIPSITKVIRRRVSIFCFILTCCICLRLAHADAPFAAHWDSPQEWQIIVADLTGQWIMTSTEDMRALEIGSGDSPICSNCFYLDPVTHEAARIPFEDRVVRGFAEKMPFEDHSFDVVLLKNFPWFFPSFVAEVGYEAYYNEEKRIKQLKGKDYSRDDLDRAINESHQLKKQVFKEIDRVLSDRGVFFVLSSDYKYEDGATFHHLSDFVQEGLSMGFEVMETTNIDATGTESNRALHYAHGYKSPLSGLAFYRKSSPFLPLTCASLLTP